MTRALTATLLVAACALPARADSPSARILVSDLSGPADESGAAAALLRSMLASGTRTAVSRVDAAAAHAQSFPLSAARVAEVLKATHADRAVVGTVDRTGDVIEVCVQCVDTQASPVAAACRRGTRGDLTAVVAEVAKAIAPALASEVDATVSATAEELAPFVTAQRLASFDPTGAERALAGADADVGARVVEARRAMAALAATTTLPLSLRVRAALAVGDTTTARSLAPAPTSGPLATLARAAEAAKAGRGHVVAHELMPLLTRTPPDAAALALIAAQPPTKIDDALESAAVAAATRTTVPELGARLLVRAAAVGVGVADAAAKLTLPAISSPRLHALAATLPTDSPAGVALAAELAARPKRAEAARAEAARAETAPSHPLPQVTATAPEPVRAAAPAPVVSAAPRVSPAVATLAEALIPLLARFPSLVGHAGTPVRVVAPPPSRTFTPRYVDTQLLGQAMTHALATEPLALTVSTAADAPLVLEYRVRPRGSKAELEVTVSGVALATPQVEREQIVVHGVDLVNIGTLFWLVVIGAVALGLGTLGAFAWRIKHVGHVRVNVLNKLGAEKETIAVRLSRSNECPKVGDVAEFDRRERKRGPRIAGNHRSLAAGVTEFWRVNAGLWYVHLYGIVWRNNEMIELPHGLTRTVLVQPGQTSYVDFALASDAAEVRIQVLDGKPVSGASVFIDTLPDALTTSSTGEVATLLPPGEYEVRISGRGADVLKRIAITDRETMKLVVDLIAERNPEAPEVQS